MKRALGFSVACFVLGTSGFARAEENETSYAVKSTRRGNFTAGLNYGFLAASSYGYPNAAGKIDNDAYVADTGVALGGASSLWIGGALRDWFTFGLGVTSLSYKANGLDAAGSGFVFRTEVFPFFEYGGVWRDVGTYASLGIGGMTLKKNGETKADGGATSIVGLGTFWEPVRFGIFSFGPSLEYLLIYSPSIHLHGAALSARLVLYTGP